MTKIFKNSSRNLDPEESLSLLLLLLLLTEMSSRLFQRFSTILTLLEPKRYKNATIFNHFQVKKPANNDYFVCAAAASSSNFLR
jgi:hypothetical protein